MTCAKGYKEIALKLVDKGANLDAVDEVPISVLYQFASNTQLNQRLFDKIYLFACFIFAG